MNKIWIIYEIKLKDVGTYVDNLMINLLIVGKLKYNRYIIIVNYAKK